MLFRIVASNLRRGCITRHHSFRTGVRRLRLDCYLETVILADQGRNRLGEIEPSSFRAIFLSPGGASPCITRRFRRRQSELERAKGPREGPPSLGSVGYLVKRSIQAIIYSQYLRYICLFLLPYLYRKDCRLFGLLLIDP